MLSIWSYQIFCRLVKQSLEIKDQFAYFVLSDFDLCWPKTADITVKGASRINGFHLVAREIACM